MSTQDSDFNAASTSTPSNGEGLGWTQVGCKQKVSTQKESAETAVSNLLHYNGTPFPGPGPTPTGHQPSQMSTQDSDFNAASTSTPSS
ncbi:hypothetical protein PSHT_02062 [Puccinia striiformis]|uniref:Uncharacterized protein n=2 Tax=Puccinia striiformis TaxID=27350 RepID=A0A2S4VFG5_9BASI|nr:hypothetical protein PSTT_07711 [Puccinia striiformis]POW21718.1 hypothetical protein PSHT_02062 [Puccinia striiformis]